MAVSRSSSSGWGGALRGINTLLARKKNRHITLKKVASEGRGGKSRCVPLRRKKKHTGSTKASGGRMFMFGGTRAPPAGENIYNSSGTVRGGYGAAPGVRCSPWERKGKVKTGP